ncbi:S8 family serine peptidase [uncultured Lacinutrix sp.]|uniref:S8 family peptidase n=1 Tax=uncultured Lacinutrix sp. TaxID=574032 RepID=UPI00260A8E93|nr:S8 family serine peptidase [uncultured Lacinutrix sp.]
MRNIQKLIVSTLLTIIFSCSNDDVLKDINSIENEKTSAQQMSKTTNNNGLKYSQSKLIIQYQPGTSQAVKGNLRDFYNVVSFEICKHCPDEMIEMWDFGEPIDIEPKKEVIEDNPTNEGGFMNTAGIYAIRDVDYEFKIPATNNFTNTPIISDLATDYVSFIKGSNTGINIAVIDTGIDTSLTEFGSPFLYNASGTDLEAEGVLSGWNFVDNTNDTYDDNSGKHGTVISKIIEQELTNLGIDFQIMPIKAFDANGEGSYFDVLCATNLALNYTNVVNMSFGWYDDNFGDFANTIFSNLLTTHSNVSVITSAGNISNNNDINKHYPSGYPQDNLFSIAATKPDHSYIADYSNYGAVSVDYFASGHFSLSGHDYYGTSFAAPKATSLISSFGTESYYIDIISSINSISPNTNFGLQYPVKYNRVIIQ